MSEAIYSNTADDTSKIYANQNNLTIALALGGKRLTKIVYADPEYDVSYDHAYYFKFFNRNVYCLTDILEYVRVLLHKSDCCLIRGVCKDDSLPRQRRLFHDEQLTSATIIEQPQHWYALDVDNYGVCTGDLKRDAMTALLALGLSGVEAFAIPSSGYLRKPGIRIRLFLWNSVKVSCNSLKKHFEQYKSVVDLALFSPIQPIYTARPIFMGCVEPCNKLVAWIPGNQCSNIVETYTPGQGRNEEKYTNKQATSFFKAFLNELPHVSEGHRHRWLINRARALGKWIYQEILDEDEVVEELYNNCQYFWGGNSKKDMETILDGIRASKMEEENGR